MYVICYTLPTYGQVWEIVSGEDAMQIRVDELMGGLSLDKEEIMVFDIDSRL